jgi:hypothetical protein
MDMLRSFGTPNALLACVIFSTSGCASYDPDAHYDAQAIKKDGRVVAKNIDHYEKRSSDSSPRPVYYPPGTSPIAAAVASIIVSQFIENRSPPSNGVAVYAYDIQVQSAEKYRVYSEFPGFEINECVKVFISNRTGYPRMAFGGECPD